MSTHTYTHRHMYKCTGPSEGIHETIVFIHIYMSTHTYIHRHMYKCTGPSEGLATGSPRGREKRDLYCASRRYPTAVREEQQAKATR